MTELQEERVDAAEVARDLALAAAYECTSPMKLLRDLLEDRSHTDRESYELDRRVNAALDLEVAGHELEQLSTSLQPAVEKARATIFETVTAIDEELDAIADETRSKAFELYDRGSVTPSARFVMARHHSRMLHPEPALEFTSPSSEGRTVVDARLFLSDLLELIVRAKAERPEGLLSRIVGAR